MSSKRFAEVRVRYDALQPPTTTDESFELALPTDGLRAEARLAATLKRPGVARDALLTIGEILASDLRHKAGDRSDYLTYLLKQGKRASNELWNAQKAFLEAEFGEAQQEESPLDPVLSVDERGMSIEVFSADESAYARLHLKAGEAYEASEVAPGTSHLRLDEEVMSALGRVRSYRKTSLRFAPSEGGEETALKVPMRWVRALSQVHSASTLPTTSFSIAPVDLYNVLLTLRLRRAKTSPRALRFELVPGERPRMVLEPWDLVIESTGEVYEGGAPKVVRTWGRRRLGVLAKLLPHVRGVKVHLVGPGLPAYYVLDLGDGSLTVALSGWTDSGWAGISTFDLLVPDAIDEVTSRRVLEAIKAGPKSLSALTEELKEDRQIVRAAILGLMQKGLLLSDLSDPKAKEGAFAHRPLFATPLDPADLRYRDERERQAHRLLEVEGQVRLTKVHDLGGEGVRIEGEVEDKQAHRTYRASFTLDREGRTVDAKCSSPQFKRAGLREGPTVPMIALRLLFARERAALEAARDTEEGRKLIRAETRSLIKRGRSGSTFARLSLDHTKVTLRWGPRPEEMRVQRTLFSREEDARDDYFRRLSRFAKRGFIDASAAESL